MARARWGDLPKRLRRKITDALGGEVIKEQSQTGGYTPGPGR
ncbi:hypothetical protein [Thermobifida halotolerans]|nr:hypothetical protein [Thermobifida halotolerans]